jgi:hypothetical protein
MDWNDVKPWVVKLAPMLGTALGPMGTLAGGIIATALGAKDASPDSIKAAITSGNLTGEQIVALKKAEEDFTLQMAALNIKSAQDLEALEYQDRDSARKMEMATKSNTPYIGFYLLSVGFFGLLLAMLFHAIPESNKAVLYTMVGSLGTVWISSANFLYGQTHLDEATRNMLYSSTPMK